MTELDFGTVGHYRMAMPAFAGTIQKWCSSDDIEQWKKNYQNKKTRQQLKSLGWIKRDIEYRFNKYGFRCDEFTDEPGVLWLGCSYTMGIGLPNDTTFAHLVSKELGLKNFNLGVGAASNNTCFRFGSYWIEKLKPKIVVLASPDISRIEMLGAHDNVKDLSSLAVPKEWFLNERNQDFNRQKNAMALYYYCSKVNAKYVWFPQHTAFPKVESEENFWKKDKARDLAHPGILNHKYAADKILEFIHAN